METDPGLEAFVGRLARRDGVLGRLLRVPDPDRGLVHTPREIAQQPYLWRLTARQMQGRAPALRAFLEAAGLYAPTCRPHLVLTGAGTSDYVGLSLADRLRVRFATAASNWPTTRITADPAAFFIDGQRYVVLHFARSGNSPESEAVLRLLLDRHPETARHVVVTCNAEGALARLARRHPERVHLVVLHEASNDRGLAMTSSFSNMVVAGQALAHLDDMAAFVDLTDRTARAGEYLLETHADCLYELAAPGLERAFYLGNGDLLGAAVESALKVQELTVGQMIAKGEDTLAFRHGPISAVDGATLVCFYLSADAYTRRYELDVVRQYEAAFDAIGARTVVLCDRPPEEVFGEAVTCLAYDPEGAFGVPAGFQVNVVILFGQLFGLFASLRRGLNVDDPAVDKALYSRTVQGVQIYDHADDAGPNG